MPDIHYDFSASGHDSVRRAYMSIADAADRAAAAMARANQVSGVGNAGAARGRTGAASGGQGTGRRLTGDSAAAEERAAARAIKAAADVGRARERETRAHVQRETEAAARIGAAEEEQERKRSARRKRDQQRGSDGRFGVGNGLVGMAAVGGAVGSLAARGVNAVLDTAMNAARETMALQESANRLSINARQAGQNFVDPTTLRKEIEAVAVNTPGQGALGIANALQSFVSLTGELETGRQSAGAFATVASATGSDVGDVAQAAASIFNQFGLKTKEEMQDVLASLTFQGKTGAFELRDAASQFQRLAAAGASFGLSGAKGVKTIGGLAQIARTGTGSAEQTTTAIENIFTNLIAKSAILKGQGVNVYDKTGKTRDVTEVLIESIVKAGKSNFEKKGQILQKVFGDQGIRGVRPLMAKYQTAFQGVRDKGGTEAEATAAGVKRLREEIEKSVNAPGAWTEVQKDAARAQEDASAQTTRSWEMLKQSVGESIGPAMADIMKLGADAAPALGAVLKEMGKFGPVVSESVKAMGDLIKLLKKHKILSDPEKTHAELAAEAETALQDFDEATGRMYVPGAEVIGPLDPRALEERKRLADASKAAQDRVYGGPSKAMTAMEAADALAKFDASTGGAPLSPELAAERASLATAASATKAAAEAPAAVRSPEENFKDTVSRYMKATGAEPEDREAYEDMFRRFQRGETGNDWLLGSSPGATENMEGRDIRHGFEADVALQRAQMQSAVQGAGSGVEVTDAQSALDDFAAKVTAINAQLAAFNAKGQGSITGATGPAS